MLATSTELMVLNVLTGIPVLTLPIPHPVRPVSQVWAAVDALIVAGGPQGKQSFAVLRPQIINAAPLVRFGCSVRLGVALEDSAVVLVWDDGLLSSLNVAAAAPSPEESPPPLLELPSKDDRVLGLYAVDAASFVAVLKSSEGGSDGLKVHSGTVRPSLKWTGHLTVEGRMHVQDAALCFLRAASSCITMLWVYNESDEWKVCAAPLHETRVSGLRLRGRME